MIFLSLSLSSSSSDESPLSTSSNSSYTSSRSSSQAIDNTLNVSFKGMSLSSDHLTATTALSKSIPSTNTNLESITQPKSSEPSTTVDPIIGPMLFFETQRDRINLCMNGFRYQKLMETKRGIKWRCYENRTKTLRNFFAKAL